MKTRKLYILRRAMIAWDLKFSSVSVPEGKVISTDISTICDR